MPLYKRDRWQHANSWLDHLLSFSYYLLQNPSNPFSWRVGVSRINRKEFHHSNFAIRTFWVHIRERTSPVYGKAKFSSDITRHLAFFRPNVADQRAGFSSFICVRGPEVHVSPQWMTPPPITCFCAQTRLLYSFCTESRGVAWHRVTNSHETRHFGTTGTKRVSKRRNPLSY